jgi:K+-sensing histidine kinase KdpD
MMQSRPSSNLRPWLVVIALLAAATGAGLLLDHHVSLTSQAMFYVLAVVIAAYLLDWLSSVISAVAAVTALNFSLYRHVGPLKSTARST